MNDRHHSRDPRLWNYDDLLSAISLFPWDGELRALHRKAEHYAAELEYAAARVDEAPDNADDREGRLMALDALANDDEPIRLYTEALEARMAGEA